MKKNILIVLFFIPVLVFSQEKITITGKVTDDEIGEGIAGVIIKAKNYNIVAMTDYKGEYSIIIPKDEQILIFSFSGRKTKEVQINGKRVINVTLEYAEIERTQIIITGMGKTRKHRNSSPYRVYGLTIGSTPQDCIDKNTEEYSNITENEFKEVTQNPLSTFSIDVDNASYSNVRRFLNNEQMPPNDAVRVEEMINYFDYDYPEPKGKTPFSFVTEISDAPWNAEHKLIHIGIQGKRLDKKDLKPSNLVFLVDVSGSMADQNKLPLLKESLKMLVKELGEEDRISLVVYASASGVVLESTPASNRTKIFEALDELDAGGSTAGGAGIKLAYKICKKNLIKNGNNRVILATDGDFNVGTSSTGALVDLITKYRQENDIYLTICGFGMGNYKDDRMEEISNAGNGNYFYIDTKKEAEKVFVKDLRANMFTIAKDVKIQIEFNPVAVKAYRLIGYENRVLADKDFNDDKKDAGELGPGHTVTAIYEIIPANSDEKVAKADDLKYQTTDLTKDAQTGDIMTLKFRYKPIKSDKSILVEQVVKAKDYVKLNKTSDEYRFAASVAAFGMLLRKSKFIDNFSYNDVLKLAKGSYKKNDEYQTEFLELIETANGLDISGLDE